MKQQQKQATSETKVKTLTTRGGRQYNNKSCATQIFKIFILHFIGIKLTKHDFNKKVVWYYRTPTC